LGTEAREAVYRRRQGAQDAPEFLASTIAFGKMSDSGEGPKKPGVPSWQLKTKDESAKEEEKPASETPSRATVIEQARKFLEEGEVRDASTDKKIAFLESKGLQSDEIQELLGVTRNSEATATAPEVNIPRLSTPAAH
jgi:hypothetical protein